MSKRNGGTVYVLTENVCCHHRMNLATLRVEGTDGDLESLKEALSLDCDTRWSKGDRRRNGAEYPSSGCNSTIADARNPRELLDVVRLFLAHCKEKRVVFPSFNLAAELSIGFTVGDSEQFVAGVEFSSAELLSFAEYGITLSITAYPTSDEANAE